MYDLSAWKTFKIIDIPKNIAEELARLHQVLVSNDVDEETKIWARNKIENIHSLYLGPGAVAEGEF